MSQFASGAEGRKVYFDAIDAALKQPGRRGNHVPRNLAEDVVLRKLRQADKLRRQLDRHIKHAIREDPMWVPTDDIAAASKDIGMDIDRQVARLASIRKAHREAMGGLTDEQMDAVFIDQLKRVAALLTEEQQHVLAATLWGKNVADVLCGRTQV